MKENKTMFVIPDVGTKTYYAADDFDTLKDGTIIIPLKKSEPKPGTMALTVTSANGSSVQNEFRFSDNAFIVSLT